MPATSSTVATGDAAQRLNSLLVRLDDALSRDDQLI
jgi:hypothetical protein